jgi:hypothetical protein
VPVDLTEGGRLPVKQESNRTVLLQALNLGETGRLKTGEDQVIIRVRQLGLLGHRPLLFALDPCCSHS